MLKAIHAQESKKAAREKARAVVEELCSMKLKEAAKKVEDSIEETPVSYTHLLLAGARVILYCSGDGTRDAKTPEALRDELVSIGCRYDQAANLRALGLDAGSSSNCDFGDGQRISNGKRVKG